MVMRRFRCDIDVFIELQKTLKSPSCLGDLQFTIVRCDENYWKHWLGMGECFREMGSTQHGEQPATVGKQDLHRGKSAVQCTVH